MKYAHELARKIAAKQASATEVFSDSLRKIQQHDPEINCMVYVNEELGLANARSVDAQ